MSLFGEHRWLIFVLPGFFSLFVAMFISDLPEINDTRLPVVYIALTFVSVALPLGCLHLFGRITGKAYTIQSALRVPAFLAGVFVSSLVVGLLFGMANTTDVVSDYLRALFGNNLVTVSSHSELAQSLFQKINTPAERFPDRQPHFQYADTNLYTRFVFKEGNNSYEGAVGQYSGRSEKQQQVYLSPACLVEKGIVTPVAGPGVWLNLTDVREIQFIYSVCSECALVVEQAAGKPVPRSCPFKKF